jgi:DNA-directed RNA polymerase subunit M/transcription elongation factor TFIIS
VSTLLLYDGRNSNTNIRIDRAGIAHPRKLLNLQASIYDYYHRSVSMKKIHELGTYDIKDDNVGQTFISFESEVWDCPKCNSVLMAVYADRIGSNTSETDFVECSVCKDSSHRIYAATVPSVKVLVNGAKRCLPKAEK